MKRHSQHDDETAMEFLRRAVGNLNYEPEGLLEQLPTTEAVVDFFDLWHAYDTEFWSGIVECIAGGDDPEPARKFIRKWKLGMAWATEVNEAAKLAKVSS